MASPQCVRLCAVGRTPWSAEGPLARLLSYRKQLRNIGGITN